MNGISSVSTTSYAAFTTATAGANASGGTMPSMQGAESGMTSVYSSVDTMLGSIDSGLAGNEMLKMAIAMLIMQSMEGGEGSGKSGKGGDELLKALASMMGQTSVATMMMSSFSSTTEQSAPSSQAMNAYAAAPAASMSGGMVNAMA